MWNQDHAKHYYDNVELMARRWQQQETYAPSFEVQAPEYVATQLPQQPNPSAASDFEMALLQSILMHQQRSQPQQQMQEQQQQQLLQQLLQQQQLQQLQQMPLPQLQHLQQLMLLQQQMQPAQQLFSEAAMGPGHQNPPSNQVFDPEAHQIPECHGAEEADLERCYSAAVSAFLNQEDEDEEDHDNDGDATNAEAQTENKHEEPVSFMQEEERKSNKSRRNHGRRLHCSFHLSEAYLQYKVVPAIIGKGGENTRAIFSTTGAKVRVRGRGSGHQETGTNLEAPTGPMVTVSTTSETSFDDAVRQTCRLLLSVQEKMVQSNPRIKDDLGHLCQYASMHDGRNFRLTENGMVEEDSVASKLRARGGSKWP